MGEDGGGWRDGGWGMGEDGGMGEDEGMGGGWVEDRGEKLDRL